MYPFGISITKNRDCCFLLDDDGRVCVSQPHQNEGRWLPQNEGLTYTFFRRFCGLSSDGITLAIGAYSGSAASGVVRVFKRSDNDMGWNMQSPATV